MTYSLNKPLSSSKVFLNFFELLGVVSVLPREEPIKVALFSMSPDLQEVCSKCTFAEPFLIYVSFLPKKELLR